MRRWHVWAGVAIAVLVVLATGWLLFVPGWAVGAVKDRVATELGRSFEVDGGAHLEFSPELAVRLDGVRLSNPADPDTAFITARALRIPVSAMQLLSRQIDVSEITLESPVVAFIVNDRSEASWDFPSPKQPAPLEMDIVNGSVRYFDARNGQSFAFGDANLGIELSADGEITIRGTADVSGRLARIEAYVKSLPRVHEDGAPADLSFDAPELSVTFNGRLATAKVLSLAGIVAVSSPDPVAALRWAGTPLDVSGFGPLRLTGSLEGAGRAFAVRQGKFELNAMTAEGDVALDFRNEIPKLQAALQVPSLDLAMFLPASGAKPGEWGTAPLGLAALKSLDAELTADAQSITYAALKSGPARLSATIATGRLDASVDLPAIAQGRARLSLAVDGGAAPPGLALGLRAENVSAADLLPSLARVTWLSGRGSLSTSLSGSGQTQQEMIGSLTGSADISLTGGALSGVGIAGGLGEVSQRILEGWPASSSPTAFDALSVTAKISDGIATLTDFRLASSELTMTGKGDVDLLRRALDLRVDPRLSAGTAAAGLPVAVAVTGPWAAPRIYPDLPGILTNPAAGFEQLKATGLPAVPSGAPGN